MPTLRLPALVVALVLVVLFTVMNPGSNPRGASELSYSQLLNQVETGNISKVDTRGEMLLSTAKGERIMEPEYGTNIRRLIFESTTTALEATIQQEIVDALAAWEPRLDLQFLQVETEPNTRTVITFVTLVSKLTNRTFMLTLNFQPY